MIIDECLFELLSPDMIINPNSFELLAIKLCTIINNFGWVPNNDKFYVSEYDVATNNCL